MSKLVPPADKIGLMSLLSVWSGSLLQSKNAVIDLSNLSSYPSSPHFLLVFVLCALGWCITWHKMLHSGMLTPLYFQYSSFIGCQYGVMFMNLIRGFLWIVKFLSTILKNMFSTALICWLWFWRENFGFIWLLYW